MPQRTRPDIASLRKNAQILVIDDLDFPSQDFFARDNYHIERWATVRNLTQLTDGSFEVILLDVQGVGLNESPSLQGLGILQAIKHANPAQMVILYSAGALKLSLLPYTQLADRVLDKDSTYIDYKREVDDLLQQHASPGHYIATINSVLGPEAALAPKVVPKALSAMRRGKNASLERYLRKNLADPKQVDRILTVISIGMSAVQIGMAVL